MGSDVDILVIGAGGCGLRPRSRGMMPARAWPCSKAGAAGRQFLPVHRIGSGGRHRFQREAGIDDDPERMVRDLMGIAKETDDLDLVRRLAGVSAETVEWLVDEVERALRSSPPTSTSATRCRGCTRPCRGAARTSWTTSSPPSKSETSRLRSATTPSASSSRMGRSRARSSKPAARGARSAPARPSYR